MVRIEWLPPGRMTAAMSESLRRLATAAYGDAFTDEDLAHALGGDHVVVRDDDGRWLAHGALVPRKLLVGDRDLDAGYVEAVATLPGNQGEGLGTAIMEALGELIAERYDIGALSTGEHEFYERLGWEPWQGPSYVIGADGVWRRSADEDDGIMVLRTGASRDIDPTAAIACHDRPGDAW